MFYFQTNDDSSVSSESKNSMREIFFVVFMLTESKAYSEPSQTSEMERFAKTVNDF